MNVGMLMLIWNPQLVSLDSYLSIKDALGWFVFNISPIHFRSMHAILTPKNPKMWNIGLLSTTSLFLCHATQNYTMWSIGQIVCYRKYFGQEAFAHTKTHFHVPCFVDQGMIQPIVDVNVS